MLRIEDLSIEFHDNLIPETVVYHFDLMMQEGEIIGLVGESGSGKTMTALAIAGLLNRRKTKKEGHIFFEGLDLLTCTREEFRKYQGKDICIIFQEPMTSLNPVKKVGWQVEESLRIHSNLSKQQRYERAIKILGDVELENPEEIYHKYPHQLSGGMRQRVMIAAAMINNPKLLIADEPTTALDVTIQAQIMKLLIRLNKENRTAILFISHDLSLIKQICQRVIIMQEGHIVEQGNVNDIFSNPKEEYTKQLIAAIPKCEKLEK
jgi:ABC-type dipeptide/oligopeptide/nickel transport system ATPase component